jgi:DNA ligase-4
MRELSIGRADDSLILAALGLPVRGAAHPKLLERLPKRSKGLTSVILEAEVVPYNEGQREGGRGPGIEEFWRLQAAGVSSELWAVD